MRQDRRNGVRVEFRKDYEDGYWGYNYGGYYRDRYGDGYGYGDSYRYGGDDFDLSWSPGSLKGADEIVFRKDYEHDNYGKHHYGGNYNYSYGNHYGGRYPGFYNENVTGEFIH